MKLICLMMLLAGAALHGQLLEPRIGVALGRDGTLLDVRGLPASFVVDRTGLQADLAACSAHLCAMQTGESLRVVDIRELSRLTDANRSDSLAPGRGGHVRRPSREPRAVAELDRAKGAVFGFSADGDRVAAFRPEACDIGVWRSSSWNFTPVSATVLAGEVVSIALDAESARLAVRRGSTVSLVRVRTSDGAIESDALLGDASAAVLVVPGGAVVFAADSAIIVQNAAGGRRRVDVPATASRLTQIGDGWVSATTPDGRLFGLQVDRARAYTLPEAEQ